MKVGVVLAALLTLSPDTNRTTLEHYVHIIQAESVKQHVDPLLVMAIITHESHWRASADNGKCIGLGQVCLATQSACAAGLDSPACQARRLELMNGSTNIRVMVGMLDQWRQHCLALTSHAQVQHILSGYAGTDQEGIQCGQRLRFTGDGGRRVWKDAPKHKIVREILEIYQSLKTPGTKTKRNTKTKHTKKGVH